MKLCLPIPDGTDVLVVYRCGMLKKRFIIVFIGLPFLVAALWYGDPWFTILITTLGILAVFEFYRLTDVTKRLPLAYLGIFFTVLVILSQNHSISNYFTNYIDTALFKPLLFSSIIVISLGQLLAYRNKTGIFRDWSWTMGGLLYVGWLLGYLVALRGLENGMNWTFFALFTIFASDTSAFFIGRAFGKHPLAPNISPRKTWEGAFGGVLGAMLLSLFFLLNTPLSLNQYFEWWQIILVGTGISVIGQAGDLIESLFKRNTGVKDSSNLFPGHGGALDRIDSIAFAGVLVYYIAIFINGI